MNDFNITKTERHFSDPYQKQKKKRHEHVICSFKELVVDKGFKSGGSSLCSAFAKCFPFWVNLPPPSHAVYC